MDAMTKIELLVETRVNGNSIKENETYENMLKSLTKNDIRSYANFQYGLNLYGSKLEMIEQIRNEVWDD